MQMNDLSYISECLIDDKSAWVQIVARRGTGGKPLPEPIMATFHVAILRHLASVH